MTPRLSRFILTAAALCGLSGALATPPNYLGRANTPRLLSKYELDRIERAKAKRARKAAKKARCA